MTAATEIVRDPGHTISVPAWRMLGILLCGQALASMDGSIINVALPSMRTELPASGAQLQLISAAYLLAFAAVVVTGARLGDRYGHARMFRVGVLAFTAASLACGLAPGAGSLIAARVAQGVAGAVMVPQVVSLIQLRFDGAARARAFGVYSMVLALGVAGGQILGGVIVTADLFDLGWRPALLLNVPVGLLLLATAPRLLPADNAPVVTRFDLVGVAVLAVAVGAVVGPLVFGREHGWPAWSIALLIAGLVGLLAFVWYERRVLRSGGQPLLDLRAVRPNGVRPGLAACFLVMGAYAAVIFAITLHLQGGLGFTPLRAGLTFVPFAAGFATMSLSWARLAPGSQRILPVIGPLMFAGGLSVLVLASATGWPAVAAAGLLFVAGAGHAASFSPLFARIGQLMGARHASALSAIGNTGSLLASAVSIAGLGSLYLAVAEHAPALSHQGLARVCLAVDAVLLVTAGCAAWTMTRRPAD